MSTYQAVLVKIDNRVLTLTLNRPERRNSFNNLMLDELVAAVQEAGLSHEVRALLITGAGKGFCAGQDLDAFEQEAADGAYSHIMSHYKPLIAAIAELEKPVIAAVNGVAAGAGMSLVLACDLRLMADDASLAPAFCRIGLVPDSGSSWFLARQLGYAGAFEKLIEGAPVPASRCLELGLVNRVVPASSLLEEASAWAARIAAMPTYAIGLTKKLLRFGLQVGLSETMELEARLQELAVRSQDFTEGVKAFREKREPVFQGK